MTIVKMGATRRYWSKQLHLDFVAKTMTSEKFESIIRYLHFKEDPAQAGSRTRKFQRIIDHFNSVSSEYGMKEHLSIDEQIISYKGIKSSLLQYNRKKPKEWGYKLFLLCGEGGIIHQVEFYGQEVTVDPEWNAVGKSGQIVLRMAKSIPEHKNHKLFFDNWFNSPNVASFAIS